MVPLYAMHLNGDTFSLSLSLYVREHFYVFIQKSQGNFDSSAAAAIIFCALRFGISFSIDVNELYQDGWRGGGGDVSGNEPA